MSKILIFLLLITTASSIPIFFPVISKPHITKKEPSVPSEQKEADNCSICDFIINRSAEMITAKTTYEDSLHIMKTACNHLPKIKYNSCNEMISENAKRMIAMISKKEDTSIICSNLHICEKVGVNISDCVFCNYASKRINFFVNENHTIGDIIDYRETFCDHIGKSYRDTCVRFMDSHYHDLIGKLIDRHTPEDACEAIRLCLK
jgi:hypothetical protein